MPSLVFTKGSGAFQTMPPSTRFFQQRVDGLAQLYFMVFHHGLSPAIKDQQVPLDLPDDLDALIALPIKINKWLMEKREG